jgi:hypothetical protein
MDKDREKLVLASMADDEQPEPKPEPDPQPSDLIDSI